MSNLDTKMTVKTILEMSDKLQSYSDQVRRLAAELEDTGDFTVCSEVVNLLINMQGNLRLDLMVSRPIREFQRAINETRKEE